jgi:nitrous oxide reductase accessory protein NosL
MRHIIVTLAVTASLAAPAAAQTADDVKAAPSCLHCGMNRETFGASRMVVEYEDGKSVGTCSIHCVAVEIAGAIDRAPKAFRVGDASTRKLLDAEKATWVIGGSKPGVMTQRAKWAFETRAAAEAFVKESGGTLATFEEALEAAFVDLYRDNRMIREKRRAMKGAKPEGHAH